MIQINFFPRFLLSCIVILISIGCTGTQTSHEVDSSEIEGFIGVNMPTTATGISGKWERGIDDLLLLKFTAPEPDTFALLEEIGFDLPLRESYRPFNSLEAYGREWDTSELTEFVGGRVTLPGKGFEVIVDTSDPNAVVTYLLSYEL